MTESIRRKRGLNRPAKSAERPGSAIPEARGSARMISLGGGFTVSYPEPSSEAASATMRANRRRDTKPELLLRRRLHAWGLRYRVDLPLIVGGIRVRPDIVFTRQRLAVFLDGCFWHGCPAHGSQPRSNSAYWRAKIDRNRARDARASESLDAAGWRVIRAWEHEPVDEVAERIIRALRRPATPA
jgi:DNA mismatch endonuclease (patch repair protein)